jgi:hypothetical protein
MIFSAFLGGFGSIGDFCLQAQVCEALTLDPVEGSLEESTQGSRAKIGMAGIGMSLLNPGIDKMKLSKSYIQEIKI